jgi:hypothetical protein
VDLALNYSSPLALPVALLLSCVLVQLRARGAPPLMLVNAQLKVWCAWRGNDKLVLLEPRHGTFYRVRARDARIRVMRRTTKTL